jgi:hypothetical protein
VAHPTAPRNSLLKPVGNDQAALGILSRSPGTALRYFWLHGVDPLTPSPSVAAPTEGRTYGLKRPSARGKFRGRWGEWITRQRRFSKQ